ncbi:hypothetical protein Taro_033675 [Colocasia esculenta]|uniref:Uncharacterized protein n=1 Tax=Colocasia esculenta TaxID=4460 RepID=A0A843W5E4_COLES|nr:hypothetical protein [Colocasia esculenta]
MTTWKTYVLASTRVLKTSDRATFHDLRLDYGIYPAVAAPETSNVANMSQKEAGLWYSSHSVCL